MHDDPRPDPDVEIADAVRALDELVRSLEDGAGRSSREFDRIAPAHGGHAHRPGRQPGPRRRRLHRMVARGGTDRERNIRRAEAYARSAAAARLEAREIPAHVRLPPPT